MSTVVKDLGAATAYGYAVEKGYTGTEAEFAELMASYATVGQTAVTAAQTATTKASEAATSATTATTKASEATTAATTATNKAAEAQADADAAALDASQALSAASTATTKATEATTAAATATSAATTATTAKDDAVSAKTAAQTAQTGAETAAASVAGSAAQIQTNAEDISQLKSDLINNFNLTYNHADGVTVNYDLMSGNDLITGLYSSTDGTYDSSRTDYCCSKNKMPCEPNDVLSIFKTKGSSLRLLYFAFYTKTGQYISSQQIDNVMENNPVATIAIVPAGAYLFAISAMHVFHEDLTPSDYGFSIYNGIKYDTTDKRLSGTYDSVGYVIPFMGSWIEGEYISKDDGSVQTHSKYHRTDYIEINPLLGNIVFTNIDSENAYDTKYNAWYDVNKTFISSFTTTRNGSVSITPPINAKYMRLSFNNTTINTISTNYPSVYSRIKWDGLQEYLRGKFVTHMSHSGSGKYIVDVRRNAIIKPLMFEFDLCITIESGYKYAYQYYDGYELGQDHLLAASGWMTQKTVIPAGTYFCLIVANSDDSTTSSTTQNNLDFAGIPNFNDVYDKLSKAFDYYRDKTNDVDFIINSGFVKTPISLNLLGELSGLQSFCIYDDKYYSVDDQSNFYVQDDAFDVLSTTTLNVGHGNALQLGNDGKAYASGWQDDTVYIVDLATKTIEDTIALPVTGYTTCAIDDVNGIAYIFQRTTYPNTVEHYNFVTYDYVNEQIISTKKTTRAFGAMQSCDFVDGKIFVLYGLGTATVPNGYVVFNTSGDILSEYVIGTYANVEPEGIFVDRETFDVYISYVNKNLYKVEAVR